MQLTFNLREWTYTAIIDMANAVSAEIDRSVDGDKAWQWLVFKALCNELTSRGLDVTDHVVCPE